MQEINIVASMLRWVATIHGCQTSRKIGENTTVEGHNGYKGRQDGVGVSVLVL